MVRPIMEYTSTVWDPHTLNSTNHLERVNARMCIKNYSRYCSVTKMLKDLDLPTLQNRRNGAKLQMLYKIVKANHMHGSQPFQITVSHLYHHSCHFKQLNTSIDSFKFSFFPSTIKLWNQLPQYLTNSATYTQFCHR